jgi:hypothetical protein
MAARMSPAGFGLLPWPRVIEPHPDIIEGRLDMSAYAADLAAVDRGDPSLSSVYQDPAEFFRTTYPSESLRRLLGDVLGVLAGAPGDRVLQLRTPFGGGKTHSLIALYHLIKSYDRVPGAFVAGLPRPPAGARVAVLSGIDLDPRSAREADGLALHTLWGELAYRLGGPVGYELVRAQDEDGAAPGADVLRELIAPRPTLILLDEVITYLVKAGGGSGEDARRGNVLVFLQALTQVVSSLPNAAMVYSLQASTEAVGAEGILAEIDHLVARVDAKREPVLESEILRVVQRRLFPSFGAEPAHLEAAGEVARAYAIAYRRVREGLSETESDRRAATAEAERFERRVMDAYPFHPGLLDLMFHRWGSLPSYQRTRGALQFLATVVNAVWSDRGNAEALIGPGSVDFGREAVRGAFFAQVGERESYLSVLAADVTGEAARARDIDRRFERDSPTLGHLRMGSRTASAILLFSFGARQGEERGALESDLVQALVGPEVDRPTVTTCLHDLRDQLLYLHHTGRRYRFEPKPNLNLLIAEEERRIEADEVLARIRSRIETDLAQSGARAAIWPASSGNITDRVPALQVVYLGLDTAEREPGEVERLVDEMLNQHGTGHREYKNALAFAVPGRQIAGDARKNARELLATEEILRQVKDRRITVEPEQLQQLRERSEAARSRFHGSVDRLYETVLLPVGDRDAERPYRLEPIDVRSIPTLAPSLHGRILEGLRTFVFDSLTPARLVSLAGLGAGRDYVACPDLLKWCFSYFDFPKLRNDGPLRRAIAQGCESVLGYVGAGRDEDGELLPVRRELVRVDAVVPDGEIDLGEGAFVTTLELARRLSRAGESTSAELAGAAAASEPQPGHESGDEGGAATQPALPLGATRYRLRATLDDRQFFRVVPGIMNLSDKAARFRAIMDIEVEADEPLTRSWLRNAVEEHFDEAGVQPETELR